MQVKIEPSSAQSVPATPGRDEEKVAKGGTRPGDDASNRSTRDSRLGGIDVEVSAQLQRARQAIEARRAGAGAPDLAAFERLPLEVDALAERIRSNPRLATVAQGEVDPSRAHRLLSDVPAAALEERARLDTGSPQSRAEEATGNANRRASRIDSAQLEAVAGAMAGRLDHDSEGTEGRIARAAWVRSLGL